ncbi:MAG TPA: type II secretion system F family protein [Planctomycetota bacterium]|nr:type II secretion system F family protein [Planctomycetota bacterium]
MPVPKPAAAKPAAAKPAPAVGKPEAQPPAGGRPSAGRLSGPAAAPPAAGRRGLFRRRTVSSKALAQFTAQLATLVNAGLPLMRCLRVLEAQLGPGLLKDVISAVAADVEGGATLSEALAKYPQVFDRLYVNMVRAGEAGGVLGLILQRLAEFARKSEAIKSQIRSALTYPILVLCFAGGILLFVMLFVVPKFETIFANFDAEMPLATDLLIGLSRGLATHWYVPAALPFVAILGWRAALRAESVAFKVDRWVLRVPVAGDLVRKTIVARFSRTLGTLLQSGVPILESLAIVKAAIPNRVLERAVGEVHDSIREGDTIAGPLQESGVFDDLVVNMIDVGEQTGQLDTMLLRVADNFEAEVDGAVSTLFKVIEPVILLVMAVLVGFIVISLFLPIVRIMDTLQA